MYDKCVEKRVKRLAILGSTGSIGRQTLDVVRALPGRFQVAALTAGSNASLLAQQVEEFLPRFVYQQNKTGFTCPPKCEMLPLENIAAHPDIDIVVMAISGTAGLRPVLAAVRAGKSIALANKESLVMAGGAVMKEAARTGARIFPVDSEHSAIWQCLQGEKQAASRILLTASGGPFRHASAAALEAVTPEEALRHPSWQMGKKVTIDSATLMNKGLEVIEAHWLFDMPFESITVLVHPQSIIHSMVEFPDGAVKAQMSHPDMRLPIQYALTYPERLPNPSLTMLEWCQVGQLTFEHPDMERFPCLGLAIGAGRKGQTYPAVLCGADEVAVELFLAKRIRFIDIPRLVAQALQAHKPVSEPALDDIIAADSWARHEVMKIVSGD